MNDDVQVNLMSQTQAKLDKLSHEAGRSADDPVEDALVGYLDDPRGRRAGSDSREEPGAPFRTARVNSYRRTRDPQVRLVFQGFVADSARHPTRRTRSPRRCAPSSKSVLSGVRDRALLLVGFAGVFRSSKLVSLEVDDANFTSDGLVVQSERSETDQEAIGGKVGLRFG